MAETVSLEGLEFEIKASSGNASRAIDDLARTLNKLKSASDKGIGSVTSKLNELNSAISSIDSNPIKQLSDTLSSLSSLNKLSEIKLPELKITDSFASHVNELSTALKDIYPESSADRVLTLQEDLLNIGEYSVTARESLNSLGGALSSIPFENSATAMKSLNDELKNVDSSKFEQSLNNIHEILSKEGGWGFVQKFNALRQITDKFNASNLNSIGQALSNISNNRFVAIPESFVNNLKLLSDTVNSKDFDESKILAVANSLQAFKGIGEIKFPTGFIKQIQKLSETLPNLDSNNVPVLKDIGIAMQSFHGIGEIKISSSLANQIKAIAEALQNLTMDDVKKLDALGNAIKNLDGLDPKTLKVKIDTGDVDKAKSKINILNFVAKSAKFTLNNLFLAPLKYAGKLSASLGKSLISPLQQVAGRIKTVIAGFGKIIKLRAFRFIITSITGGIKEGTDNLYQFSKAIDGEFAQSMDTLATSMLYFKNSVGASFAPLINYAAPAIDLLVDKIVDATNKINQFFAQMTGSSYWTKALKYPKEYAEAVDSAKDAMQSFTMGFDELNIISDNSSDKNANDLDYSKMFELQPLVKNPWVEELKNAIESDDWYGAGVLLGEKFNDVFSSINYEEAGSILGHKINDAINLAKGFIDTSDFRIVGSGIAQELNSVFENISFYNLGSVLSGTLNSIFDTVNGFVNEFKFAEFGKDLSETVNGFFDNVDLNTGIHALSTGLQGILDTVYNFLHNTSWTSIGEKLGGAITSIFNELPSIMGKLGSTASEFAISVFTFLSSTIQSVDWKNVGLNLYESVKELITNIEWAKLADSFFGFLGSALGMASGAIFGFFAGLATDLYDSLKENGEFTFTGFLKGIGKAIASIATWIKDHIFSPFINGFKKAFGIASPSKEMAEQGGYIISGLLEGIVNALASIKTWLKDHIFGPFINGFKSLFGINSPSTVMKDQGMYIIGGLKNGIMEAWSNIKQWVKNHIVDPFVNGFKNLFGIHSPSTVMKENGEYIIDGLKSGLTWDNIKSWTKENLFDKFINGFKELFGIHSPSKIMEEQGNYIVSGLENGITNSEKWGTIKSALSDSSGDISGIVEGEFNTLKTNLDTTLGSIAELTSNKFNGIKNTAGEIFSNFGDGIKKGLNAGIAYVESFVNSTLHAFNVLGGRLGSFSFTAPQWVQEQYGIGGWSIWFPYLEPVSLPRFEKGGFPNSGDLFFANENGHPEFVGSIGGKTAVANNDQITAGIYEAVYSAMMAVMSNQGGDGEKLEVSIYMDSKDIAYRLEERKKSRGQTIFTGGVVNEF